MRSATGASESSGLNSPSVGRPRCEVTITAAPASSAMRMQGMEARMRVSSVMVAGIVLRDVEVGTDENALAGGLALGAQVGEAENVHGGGVPESKAAEPAILEGAVIGVRVDPCQYAGAPEP